MDRNDVKKLLKKIEDILSLNDIAAYGIVLAVTDGEESITVVGRAASRFPDNDPQALATHMSMKKVISQSIEELDSSNKKKEYLN